MQTHQLERMLRLANKTGGKLIITDASGNRPVVILGLDEYEALLDGKIAKTVGRRTSGFQDPEYPTNDVRRNVAESVEDDEADVTVMEEALMAVEEAMPEAVSDEPSVVPVKVVEMESEAVNVPVESAKDQPAPNRLVGTASEFGEEQFYLEPL